MKQTSCDERILSWGLTCLISCTVLLGGCAGKQSQRAGTQVSQSRPPEPADTSGVTVTWPTQVKRFEVINAAMEAAVIAAYVNASAPPPGDQRFPTFILAVWKDGRVLRSANPILGGPPFLEGHVLPQKVAEAIERLTTRVVESNVEPCALQSGPDFRTTTLQFRTRDGHVFEMTSWHEIMEEDGEYLYGRGFETVRGKESIPAIVARRTPEYREFRSVWDSLRATMNQLFPQDMKATTDPGFLFRNVRTGETLKRTEHSAA